MSPDLAEGDDVRDGKVMTHKMTTNVAGEPRREGRHRGPVIDADTGRMMVAVPLRNVPAEGLKEAQGKRASEFCKRRSVP